MALIEPDAMNRLLAPLHQQQAEDRSATIKRQVMARAKRQAVAQFDIHQAQNAGDMEGVKKIQDNLRRADAQDAGEVAGQNANHAFDLNQAADRENAEWQRETAYRGPGGYAGDGVKHASNLIVWPSHGKGNAAASQVAAEASQGPTAKPSFDVPSNVSTSAGQQQIAAGKAAYTGNRSALAERAARMKDFTPTVEQGGGVIEKDGIKYLTPASDASGKKAGVSHNYVKAGPAPISQGEGIEASVRGHQYPALDTPGQGGVSQLRTLNPAAVAAASAPAAVAPQPLRFDQEPVAERTRSDYPEEVDDPYAPKGRSPAPQSAAPAAKPYPYFKVTTGQDFEDRMLGGETNDAIDRAQDSAQTAVRYGAWSGLAADPNRDAKFTQAMNAPDLADQERRAAVPSAFDYLYSLPTTEQRAFARKKIYDRLSPRTIDNRAPEPTFEPRVAFAH